MALFPPLDKRNTYDKAKGLRISSERCIGELGVRFLGTLNREQDSWQQSHIGRRADLYGGYYFHLSEARGRPHRGAAWG